MKYIAAALAFATAVAGHGYVNNATIGSKAYTFYQPYQDPYTSPTPQRISREIQGNGPVQDVTSADLQCGGYTEGGIVGSKPAALHAEVAAGSEVDLYWTLWPDSHVGPTVTYMAKCPDAGCNTWMPNATYVSKPSPPLNLTNPSQRRLVQGPRDRPHRHLQHLGRHSPHEGRWRRHLHGAQVHPRG